MLPVTQAVAGSSLQAPPHAREPAAESETMKICAAIVFALFISAGAKAQSYPHKAIAWVVPFPPGGTTDLLARIVAGPLARELGQAVNIENREGEGGSVGTAFVARARPDGYTIGMATVSTHAVNPACNPQLPYHPIKDFLPVTNLARTPNVLTANNLFPAGDFKELLGEVKRNPGKYVFASTGQCSVTHLMGELFQISTGTVLRHAPYRGAGPALLDLASGKVPLMFDNLPSSIRHIKDGSIRAIAVASEKRLASLPNVPTFREVQLRPVNDPAWYGVMVPMGTPVAVIDRLHRALVKVLAQPDVRARMHETGAEPVGNSPADFWVEINSELGKMTMVARKQRVTFSQ